jgi:AAA+ ATPase superfamily predicted ATPase
VPELPKPSDMFDRDWEWSQLVRFALDDQAGATLGIVSGRRRQGKTFLLEALCEETRGFYYAAPEAVPQAEGLRQLGEALADHLQVSGSIHFDGWGQALDALLDLATSSPLPVVLDEFPYLVKSSPELPSLLQRALSPRRPERRASRCRIFLCGSAVSFMGKLLLSGSAPLRGRAGLELVVPTFNFRQAADFWDVSDHRLAMLLHSIVGGTPAYRTEFLRVGPPASLADFDSWVVQNVLSPASPLFREVRALLAEDPSLVDTGLYHTVLAAVAEGNATRSGIANRIGRKAADISHHLTVLQDSGFLVAEPDAFRANRSEYWITEPLVRFHHAIIRPSFVQLERVRPGRTERIWATSQPRFLSNVVGPDFERVCRRWSEDFADPSTFGGQPARALSGVVNDPHGRTAHQVDLAVFDPDGRLLAIGEVKWGHVVGMGHLARLETIATLLAGRGLPPGVLALFSGNGFASDLEAAARSSAGSIQLVDLARLYTGS